MALNGDARWPALDAMQREGVTVAPGPTGLPLVSVGLLNLMPDAALRATDLQFVRQVSAAAGEFDVAVLPFTVAAESRGEEARGHIAAHYSDFETVATDGVDALIVTGANPAQHNLEREVFWDGLGDVLDWASKETRSVLCSCLATHAVLERYRETVRTRLPQKRWGVYDHQRRGEHPLLDGLGESVEAPHSHWYDVTRAEMESAGLTVLLESEQAGVHMAVDEDDFYVFFQGHPEYDPVSLLKEYRRELGRYYRGERDDYPPVPEHYFDERGLSLIAGYRPILEEAKRTQTQPPGLSEAETIPTGVGAWVDQGQIIYRNWLRRLAG